MTKFVTIAIEDKIATHMRDYSRNYATMCGIDGDDPLLEMYTIKTPKGQKIDCPQCIGIWQTAKKYKTADFHTIL